MRIALLAIALTTAFSWAQKKPVTIEATLAVSRAAPVPNWSPDGGRFLTISGTKLMMREVVSGSERELIDLKALEAAKLLAIRRRGQGRTNIYELSLRVKRRPADKDRKKSSGQVRKRSSALDRKLTSGAL